MERDTKEFTTAKGKKVIYYAYLSGREINNIKSILFKGISVTTGPEGVSKPNITEYPLEMSITRERELIKAIIVSVDGVKENVLDLVENLQGDEYKEIVAVLEPVAKGNF